MSLMEANPISKEELLPFSTKQRAALEGTCEMTYDLFWECLQVCFDHGRMDVYQKIWTQYPNQAAKAYRGNTDDLSIK